MAASLPTIDTTAIERQHLPETTGFAKRTADLEKRDLTPMTANLAVELDTDCKRFIELAEKERVEMKKPILEAGRRIDEFFKKLMSTAMTGRAVSSRVIGTYQREQLRKANEERFAAEKLAREQAEAQRKAEAEALAAEAAATGDESLLEEAARVEATPIAPILVPVVEAPKLEGVSVSMVKKGRIVDARKVLAALLARPESDLINEIIEWKQGGLDRQVRRGLVLDGVEVIEEPATRNLMR